MPHSYAIIGSGALGALYGALLQRAGKEVHFLFRSDYDHVAEHGLRIDSVYGDFMLPEVRAYDTAEAMPACDVVLVGLKATANAALPDLLPEVIADDGVVLLMQNGLDVEPEVARIVGHDRVMGGLAFLCSNRVRPGHIHHLDYGAVTLGDYRKNYEAAGRTPRLEAVGRDFEEAGVETHLLEDLLLGRWKKLVWNIPFNGLSVVLDTTTDRIMADPGRRAYAERLMKEVVAGAAGYGRTIKRAFVRKMLDDTARMKPYRTSMMIDYENRRPMEIEAIFGNPIRAAERVGVEMPETQALYHQLQMIQQSWGIPG